ncbi:MAG: DUF2513 domain-containing protein [Pseudomonadota bacterium]|nr:DUF2513 domain-containing protein [Pseudomonadota bacterium]
MKRNFDLIRLILLDIESKTISDRNGTYEFAYDDRDAVAHSLELMLDHGLIEAKDWGTMGDHPADKYGMVRMTWEGADFLDTVRDEEIWKKTKAGAEAAKGFSFDLLKALAKGFVKKQIEAKTGVELSL